MTGESRTAGKHPRPSAAKPRGSRPRSLQETVRKGWNRLSFVYRPARSLTDATGHPNREYRTWLQPLLRTLPAGSPVLDLGCGSGTPAAGILSSRFRVTGIDLSDVQIRRARKLLPKATFVRAEMTTVRFPPESFTGVVSLYSMIHVPVGKHRPLLRRIYRWLTPGGLLLAIVGHNRWTGTEVGWLGLNAEMYWSHASAATYEKWLREAGFEIRRRKFIPEGKSGHEMFLAQKPEKAERKATSSGLLA